MSQAAWLIGARLTDPSRLDIPGSKVRHCSECGAWTVFSPATLARSEASHPGSRFACLECATKRLEGVTLLPPTGAQVNERAEAGHDPQAWPLREQWGKRLVRRG